MKAVVVFMLLAVAADLAYADDVNYFKDDLVSKISSRSIGDKIKAFLESLKETMKKGNESMGISPLDPLNLKHQEIDLDHELVKFQGEVNNFYLQGLSGFEVQHADFKISKKNFSIKLFWPNIKGSSLYNIIEAKFIDLFPLFGKGDAKFEVTSLTFGTNAKLKLDLKNKKIEILEFSNTEIFLDGLKVDATGLFNDNELSEFVSAVISDIVPQGIVDFQKKITTQVNEIMLKVGNKVIPSFIEIIWGVIMP